MGSVGRVGHVTARWTVAIFATVLCDAAFFVGLLPMRTLLPARVNIRVTRFAGFRTCVVGSTRRGIGRRVTFPWGGRRLVCIGARRLGLCKRQDRQQSASH